MNLDDIPGGSLCLVDTGIFLLAEQGRSEQCRRLIRRVSQGEIIGSMPGAVWLELAEKLTVAEALMLGSVKCPDPVRRLADKPEVVKGLKTGREKLQALMTLGFGFVPGEKDDLLKHAPALQEKLGLMPHEALLLVVARRIKADHLVTTSPTLAAAKEKDLAVAAPTD